MHELTGVRIAVTRPLAQSEELARPLRALGAEVLIAPLIKVVAAPIEGALRAALQDVARYNWIVFSSVNGVEHFMAALPDARQLSQAAIACVGPATAAAAEKFGLHVDAVPAEFVGEAIADALQQHDSLHGKRILLARAGGANEALPARLRAEGASVDDVELYRSVPDEDGARLLRQQIQSQAVDVLTFTSSSAVRYFMQRMQLNDTIAVAVIGPVTAQTARAGGMAVTIEAQPHTVGGLVDAIVQHYGSQGSPEDQ